MGAVDRYQFAHLLHVIYEQQTGAIQTVGNEQLVYEGRDMSVFIMIQEKDEQTVKGNDEPDPYLNEQVDRFVIVVDYVFGRSFREASLFRIKSG